MAPVKEKSKIRLLLGLPEALLVISFGGVILLGGTLPSGCPGQYQPGKVSFLNALFTSTSAVCVTGLTVVDTGADFTRFGQIVIMLLIQAEKVGDHDLCGPHVSVPGAAPVPEVTIGAA